MPRSVLCTSGVLLAVVLYFAQMMVFDQALAGARVDLTAEGLFTLSEGSEQIAAGLAEPIEVILYYSEELGREIPFLPPHARRVQELLREYELASEGKITLKVVDPVPFTEAEDDAVAAGLGAVPINEAGDRLYLGLVATNAVGETEVIPFFYPERDGFLEFDVSSFLAKLDVLERPKLAVVSGLPIAGQPALEMPGAPAPIPPWRIVELLGDGYALEFLEPGFDRIPEDSAALLVLHPQQLPPASVYAIDQFALSGKGVVVCVDPLAEAQPVPAGSDDPFAALSVDRSSQLPELFAAWGLSFDANQVVADIDSAVAVRSSAAVGPRAVDYVVWMDLGADGIAADEPLVSDLRNLTLATPGALAPLDEATTRFTPLLSTGPRASLISSMTLAMGTPPEDLLRNYRPGDARQVLAARVDGPASSAFPEGPPESVDTEPDAKPDTGPLATDAASPAPHRASSEGDIHIVVVADTDMFEDRFWVAMAMGVFPTVITDNGSFLANALDALSGHTELLGIRGSESTLRSLDRVDELRRAAEKRYLQKEQDLQRELSAIDAHLAELLGQRDDGGVQILSPDQADELAVSEEKLLETRKQLRSTRAALRADIDELQGLVRAINILGVPALVLLIFGARALRRRRPSGAKS